MAYANVTEMANATSPIISASLDDFKFSLRMMLYLVSPNETTFEHFSEVPNYFLRGLVYLPVMMAIECFMLFLQGRKQPSFADGLCSMCCGLLIFLPVKDIKAHIRSLGITAVAMLCYTFSAVIGQLELSLYIWCYEKFHIIDLPWNSVTTWIAGFIAADLGFYIWHRSAHEINFIWAFHQVHHTSQEFNLLTGIRLPSLNRYVAILFYLPSALVLPPPMFYVHYQFNYIFQFWIHSGIVPSFGIFDYIINNPSLHRVHHGRNRYCIDKNYGAVLSIWDLLFGTFEREKTDQEIYYGLVHSIRSFDPIYIQLHHLKNIWNNVMQYNSLGDKISACVKGPGWMPGKPRLGHIEDIPEEPEDKEMYSIVLPFWVKAYLFVHYLVAFVLFFKIKITKMTLSPWLVYLHGGYVLVAMATTGMFLERRRTSTVFEGLRCAFYFVLEFLLADILTSNVYLMYTLRSIFFVSFLICAANLNLFSEKTDAKVKAE